MPPQFTPELQVTCLNIPYKQVFFSPEWETNGFSPEWLPMSLQMLSLTKGLRIPYKQMAFLQNEFSYDASDVELEKWTLNDSSYDSSDVQLQKTTLNIPYKQIAFLNNESSYDFSGVQIHKMTSFMPHIEEIKRNLASSVSQ